MTILSGDNRNKTHFIVFHVCLSEKEGAKNGVDKHLAGMHHSVRCSTLCLHFFPHSVTVKTWTDPCSQLAEQKQWD